MVKLRHTVADTRRASRLGAGDLELPRHGPY